MTKRLSSARRAARAAAFAWSGALICLGLAAGSAHAQEQQEEAVPKIAASKPAIEWTIGAGFLVGCLIVAFKNSKRSHVQ